MIYTDQLMREVRLHQPPSRIVSLVPSITELLSDLELDEAIAGITKFCIHPEHIFRSRLRVGGTKKVDHEKIIQLNPDLILANKEENTKDDIESLEKNYPVWISDVNSLEDALEMIRSIGDITARREQAEAMNDSISNKFKALRPLNGARVLYLIWKDPYMAAGANTFIDDMLKWCGFSNILHDKLRYPEISITELNELHPDVVLLSSEPYPFNEKHITEMSEVFPDSKIITVDGTYFSWYGSRLLDAPEYFDSLLTQLRFSQKVNPAV
jgi:ABC-type Fe3+-hydroxamate transport system substrate-binding protein